MGRRTWVVAMFFLWVAGCAHPMAPSPLPTAPTPIAVQPARPVEPVIQADWDHQPEGALWTQVLVGHLQDQPTLVAAVPGDAVAFCPRFAQLDAAGRTAFWVAVFSAMARFESGFDPSVAFDEYEHCTTDACRRTMTTRDGRHVVSRGLLQLSQESAHAYVGCHVPPARETTLHDPNVNLGCAVAIMARWVTGDGTIADRVESQWRGGARYWSVLRPTHPRNTLPKIKAYVAQTEICRPA